MTDDTQVNIKSLQQAIAALEAQRAILGNAVVDASLFALRKQLAELEVSSESREQRKQATVLFADLVGFTALSEKLDPEDVRQVQQAYFDAVTPPIHKGGGWVEKYIGDAILAVFGLPQAQENDPDQAVRAALKMQAALGALNKDLAGRTTLRLEAPLKMRVGVNTGLVVVNQKGPFDFTVTGDMVNLASRLQSAAPPGGVLISQDTYRHVRGAFDLQALEPIEIKGKAEPVQTYLALAVKPRSFRTRKRGVEGIETHMVGREGELQTLQNAYFSTVEDGEPQMVTIVAEPGLGKSRLLYEFENWVDLRPERAALFRGRARQETQHLPYSLLRDLFAFHLGIQDDDALPAVWRKLENGLAEIQRPGQQSPGGEAANGQRAHFIGHLLGYDFSLSPQIQAASQDPRQLHDRGLGYLVDLFKAGASRSPILIFFEDLHWADDSSLDAIARLARSLRESRALLVAATRPTLYERRENWMEGQDFHLRIDLRPLSKRDSRRLVEDVLQKVTNLPDDLRELLISNAEGNPFYLEELVKMLVEDGVIVKGPDNWLVQPERLKQAQVPPTLVGVLQARLDSLPERERGILQQASVVGRVFWDKAVEHFYLPDDEAEVDHSLLSLRDKEMIYRRELSAFAGAAEHIFKHAILREVAYESVLKRLRRKYHALAADWLIEQGGERAGELTGLIADHLELAGENAQAAAFLTRAGDDAAAKYLNQEAIQFYGRALDLVSETELAARRDLLFKREKLFELQGQRELQERDLAALAELLEAPAGPGGAAKQALNRVQFLARRAWLDLAIGNFTQAAAGGEQALDLAKALEDPGLTAEVLAILGLAAYRQGRFAEARLLGEQSLEVARAAGDQPGQRRALNMLGMLTQDMADWAAAEAYLREGLVLARQTGDRRGESSSQSNLAMLLGARGDLSPAKAGYLEALRLAREIGERPGEGTILANLGWLFGLWGDFAAASEYCSQYLQIAQETEDRLGEVVALVNLSSFECRQRSYPAALAYAQRGLAGARSLGSQSWTAWALTYLGNAQAGLGLLPEAEASYREAVTIRQALDQPALATEPQAGLARLALARGDSPAALSAVDGILAYLAEGGSLEGTDETFNVYLTCIVVLVENNDPRARALLEQAHARLLDQAARISDDDNRRSFLENVPWHREIVALWNAIDFKKAES